MGVYGTEAEEWFGGNPKSLRGRGVVPGSFLVAAKWVCVHEPGGCCTVSVWSKGKDCGLLLTWDGDWEPTGPEGVGLRGSGEPVPLGRRTGREVWLLFLLVGESAEDWGSGNLEFTGCHLVEESRRPEKAFLETVGKESHDYMISQKAKGDGRLFLEE